MPTKIKIDGKTVLCLKLRKGEKLRVGDLKTVNGEHSPTLFAGHYAGMDAADAVPYYRPIRKKAKQPKIKPVKAWAIAVHTFKGCWVIDWCRINVNRDQLVQWANRPNGTKIIPVTITPRKSK